jgi:CheY-like chemotaxis protein
MLVEGRQDDRAMYAEYLRTVGLTVVEVGDAGEALRRMPEVDLVVTGVRVPGSFDGLELVRRVRADARLAGMPVIVLTAAVLNVEGEQAATAGCDRFLAKPCLPETLLTEIRRLLPKSGNVPSGRHRAAKAQMRSSAAGQKKRR